MFGAYERSAEVYDVLYEQMLDYDAAAGRVAGLIRERNPAARTLLEVASGTGAYLARLARYFDVTGLDRSPHMLAAARRKLPDVEMVEADMTSFDLGRGFDVDTVNILRAQLRERGVTCRVAKNTLIKRAIADTEMEIMGSMLAGPTALFWHEEEPSVAAKVIKEFRKELNKKELIKLKGAYIDGETISDANAMSLADIPSKDELRAQMLGLVKAVPGKFLALMETAPRKFLGVLEARKQQLEDEAA